jgi:glutathione S-transferase
LKSFWEKDADNCADQIENMITLYSNNGEWCLGNTFTYADLFVFEIVNRYFPTRNDLFTEKYQRIYNIKKHVEEKSNAAEYIRTSDTQQHKAEVQREE